MDQILTAKVLKAIVNVGTARGFVVGAGDDRYVITAAHCLPHLPSADGREDACIYPNLLGPLTKKKRKVWAECVFVDPVSDIAVLGSPGWGGSRKKQRAIRR